MAARRIAILGGGISGLTTAYELSRTPELREKFDVTVFQLGWRLGGKLASGRNPDKSWRNEEHGLHVWFGFYDNTFALTDEVLKQWDAPPECPYRSVEDIVAPHDVAMFAEELPTAPGRHRFHTLHFARTPGRPGLPNRPDEPELSLVGLTGLVQTLKALPQNLRDVVQPGTHPPKAPPLREAGSDEIVRPNRLLESIDAVVQAFNELMIAKPDRREVLARRTHAACVAAQLATRPSLAALPKGQRLLHSLYNLDICLAVIRGVCSPEFKVWKDGDLDRVQDYEFDEWLLRCGASRKSIECSAILKCQYDAFFQYAGSDRGQPSYEASTCARIFLRGLLGFRGAVAWMLQTGMGEALIAPLYEVLKARGVNFEFFHRVVDLELDESATNLSKVHMLRQARLRNDEYEPLVTYRGERVWLSKPDWSQLEDGESYAARGVNFESRWSPPALDEPRVLEHGADFDEVVLALPLGALVDHGPDAGPAKKWFDAYPPARRAAGEINLMTSVAAQLWLKSPMEEYGWPSKASVVGWGHDYSIFCDMTPVLHREGFGGECPPQSTVYLCGIYPLEADRAASDDLEAKQRADDKARELLQHRLETAGEEIFGTDDGFDWNELYTHHPAEGSERLDDQYIRANIEPWDLCDGATPGTARLRLEAHQSGLDNMALASTWTRTGMNTTCVEGAIMSGMAAARALGGLTRPIRSEAFLSRPFEARRLRSIERAEQLAGSLSADDEDRLATLYDGAHPTEGPLVVRDTPAGETLHVSPDCDVALLQGELEVWRDDRLDRYREAPWLSVSIDDETMLRACEPCRWVEVPVKDQRLHARNAALLAAAREGREACDNYLRTYDDFFDAPNAQLVPGPYRFGPFDAKLLLVKTCPKRLQELLPPGFRRIPGLGGHYLLIVADLENVAALSPGAPDKSWGYRETTPLIPCMSGASLPGAFVPELYPDAPMPVLLGRETYGFPKRIGRTTLTDEGADVIVDHERILKARWGTRQSADPGTLAQGLSGAMIGRVPPKLGELTNWTQEKQLPLKLPVYVRQQFLSRNPGRKQRWREDRVVQVPFEFMPLERVARLPNATVSFADDHPVLHGELVQAWAVRTGFEFGKSKVARTIAGPRRLGALR